MTSLLRDDVPVPMASAALRHDHLMAGQRRGARDGEPDNASTDDEDLHGGESRATHSAAMRTSGAAARTSASTCFSYLTKFSWNMRTSLRAVSSKADLSFQVFIG